MFEIQHSALWGNKKCNYLLLLLRILIFTQLRLEHSCGMAQYKSNDLLIDFSVY